MSKIMGAQIPFHWIMVVLFSQKGFSKISEVLKGRGLVIYCFISIYISNPGNVDLNDVHQLNLKLDG